jgi:hypothetical protein
MLSHSALPGSCSRRGQLRESRSAPLLPPPSAGQFLAVIITQLNIRPAIRPLNHHRARKLRITVIPGRNRGNHIIRRLRNTHRPGPLAQPVRRLPRTRLRSVRHRRIRERHGGNRRAPPSFHLYLPGPRLEHGTRIPVIVTRLEAVISERPRQRHPRRRRIGSSRTSRTRGQQHTAHQQQPETPTHRRCPRSSRSQSPSRLPRGLSPASGGTPALPALASRGISALPVYDSASHADRRCSRLPFTESLRKSFETLARQSVGQANHDLAGRVQPD